METWLRPNIRPILMSMILPTLGLVAGIVLGWGAQLAGGGFGWLVAGALIATVSLVGIILFARMLWTPRLAYSAGFLQVDLGTKRPIRVPIDVVECFFPGQGPAMMPPAPGADAKEPETANIIVRLAESAETWKHQTVRPELGHWCDGYIVIRGTWCERISGDLLKKLNQRLVEVHRLQRQSANAHLDSAPKVNP